MAYSEMKFDEALKVLNDAAIEKKGDLMKMISSKYEDLKGVIEEVVSSKKENVESAFSDAYHEGRDKTLKYTRELNQSVHQNPWPFIAGVAVGSWLLGITIRNCSK